ncbi:potassium channel subfamily K member 18 isoform X1 [Daphnia magna]|uniref:Potassium channel domain-containing protein n=1 Tax=Daphnia magna TaxID=35525 RepID=A0A164QGP1_9CRUS|nr:potassium channel subfamily K member 18 isoform X1 [Daphnia magna]XP_045035817.1 potassium channel subfamily K member 18 isoform X1 [Daphnia magna]KZS07738.1 Uncharacterized protein APZ42_028484 [Daphnia magna]
MSSDFEIDNSAGQTGATGLNHNQWNVVAGDSSSDAQHLRSGRSTQQPCSCCTRCWTTGCTWLTSALGVSLLLFVYLITGAVMFMVLGNHETMASSDHSRAQTTGHVRPGHHHHADPDARLLDKTMATVDRLWSITEDLNILYRDNWTHLARVEMRHYQDQIVRTLRQIMLEERYSFRQTWTFPMSLLYALTLITTIGYGFYTPTTVLARSLTTGYSLLGIPLFLLYLSVVGERLARIINRMTLSCCCCCNDNVAGPAGDDEEDEENGNGRPGRRRLGAYRQYSDVTLALQPVSLRGAGSNGHVSQQETASSSATVQQPFKSDAIIAGRHLSASIGCSNSSDTTQVPLLVCAGLLAVFVGLASFLLVLFEPQLGFFGSLHLTINLLMTLGFAGNLLPGMSAETAAPIEGGGAGAGGGGNHRDDKSQAVGSQISLVIVACLILVGTTLLSSSFSVLMDNLSLAKSPGGSTADGASSREARPAPNSATCYHHMPSPNRQFS